MFGLALQAIGLTYSKNLHHDNVYGGDQHAEDRDYDYPGEYNNFAHNQDDDEGGYCYPDCRNQNDNGD